MITKRELCEIIVNRDYDKELSEAQNILSSSCLAVSMEMLNLITEDYLKEYVKTREGIVLSGKTSDGYRILGLRKLLSLLPD